MSALAFLAVGLVVGALVERLLGPPGRRRRSPLRLLALGSLLSTLLLVGAAVGGYLWASSVFDRIEKVEVGAQLSHGSGTNYLLVGSDNGRDPDDQREGVDGSRSDTILVLRVASGQATMLSLNRDLWVDNPATGQKGRLNATYNAGPANLIAAVTQNFGIPIDRYLEIDFSSFAGLVDAFGGIDVTFAHPALDRASGLNVPTAGVVHLDGTQALAYVRSRHYTEVIDGKEVPEGGLPDVNRTGRQQTFLRELFAEAAHQRSPLTLMHAATGMADGLRIDDQMTLVDAARFAWSMGRLHPVSVVLPVVPRRTSGGADVLDLGAGADGVLAAFR